MRPQLPIPALQQHRTIRDQIIFLLGSEWPQSAKKLYNTLRAEGSSVSYQAAHKALKEMVTAGVVIKDKKNYKLNITWIKQVSDFLNKMEAAYNLANESRGMPLPDVKRHLKYTRYKFRYIPISFIPFRLGSPSTHIPKDFDVLHEGKRKVTFRYNGNTYHWFDTGICVMVHEGIQRQSNIIDYLLHRRHSHLSILHKESPFMADIEKAHRTIQKTELSDADWSYVMTIAHIEQNIFIEPSIMETLLKLIVQPSILGITDDPQRDISKEFLEAIERDLHGIEDRIQRGDIDEIPLPGSRRAFATWGTVIIYCPSEDKERFMEFLTNIEVELQHLWFFCYHTKTQLKAQILSTQEAETAMARAAALWEEFTSVSPTSDNEYHSFRDVLIRTSKLRRMFKELEGAYSMRERGKKP